MPKKKIVVEEVVIEEKPVESGTVTVNLEVDPNDPRNR